MGSISINHTQASDSIHVSNSSRRTSTTKPKMSSSGSIRKPHVVCLPFPAQGHVSPFMQLARLLHWRGFHITFVNTQFNHSRLLRSKGPAAVEGLPDFRFETIPDGLPPSHCDASQDAAAICESTQKNCFGPFKELLIRLNSSPDVAPPVSCVISDGTASFGMRAAQELGIADVQFWTASACGFMGCLSFPELVRRGIYPFKDESVLEEAIDWIPGMPNIRVKDLPNYIKIRALDPNDVVFKFMEAEAQACLNEASAIILNTCAAFEHQVVKAIKEKFPREIYTVGFLSLLTKCIPEGHPSSSLNVSLWKEDTECLEWLDGRKPGSVVYINYGSVATMGGQEFMEFAWGLAQTKHSFLWIVRPDILEGDLAAVLPEEFHLAILGRGKLASWCPQEKVLSHPAVGAFLTHCGWNSVTEAVGSGGVPLICWPFFADQQTNCRFACTPEGWGNGVEVGEEVWREDVVRLLEEVMEGEKGREMKRRAREWKRLATEAVDDGGSSATDFDRLVREALHFGSKN